MAPLSHSARRSAQARKAIAYYQAQAASYRKAGLTAAAERCDWEAALASLNLRAECKECHRPIEATDAPGYVAYGLGPECAAKARKAG